MENVTDQDHSKKAISRDELIKIVQYSISRLAIADIRTAVEESCLAQDFISLLLSAVRPAAGGASMSPALKNAVPVGALGVARTFPQQQKPDLAVTIGWKKSAIESASQTLLAAADRLSQHAGQKNRFVEGVVKIRSAGWAIVQMPANAGDAQQSMLKVYYGFQKGSLSLLSGVMLAGSDFHDPGVGYLKESASGDLVFIKDVRFADKKDRTLRVRVETKDGITSSFSGPKDYKSEDLLEAEIDLFKARDSLFDEELYHEVENMLFSD